MCRSLSWKIAGVPLFVAAFLTAPATPTGGGPWLTAEAPDGGAQAALALEVQAIFEQKCFRCHGKDKRGDLDLRTRERILAGAGNGPIVIPGKPAESRLFRSVSRTQEPHMPPAAKQQLSADELRAVRDWIALGVPWPEVARPERHWSFESLRAVTPPAVQDSRWAANPIDAFVLARLEAAGFRPAERAERRTLIRRAYLDLIGLPPTPEEVEAAIGDNSKEWYAHLVDRLLASPNYGERWGRHWLDVVRYADTGGFEDDIALKYSWRYRDYAIRSLNADKPYDRFLQEQVAGDEMWPGDDEALTATSLYSVGPMEIGAAIEADEFTYEWLTDAVDTTGAVFLGLTVGCARCHDHKYDPLTQRDYFALQAVFAGSEPAEQLLGGAQTSRRERAPLALWHSLNRLRSEVRKPQPPSPSAVWALQPRATAPEVRRLHRGQLNAPREVVAPAIPTFLGGQAVTASQRRTGLARWLTAPENPLTARVMVNRVWGWHFGQPLVPTANDFGTQGTRPSHPQLLDWLARDFVHNGWSLKHLHRTIMLSQTYQMSSRVSPLGFKADPQNQLLARFPRRRLEAETLWDSLHAVAGTLNRKAFGPPAVPPLTREERTGLWEPFGSRWIVSEDQEFTRRGVYLFVRRSFQFPFFGPFDPPNTSVSCPGRQQSTVPTQALALLNSELVVRQARAFAGRLLRECGDNPTALLARAWLLALGRPIGVEERTRALRFVQEREAALARFPANELALPMGLPEPLGISRPRAAALTELCLALFNTSEFVYVD